MFQMDEFVGSCNYHDDAHKIYSGEFLGNINEGT
jgi:hypothetical protein